MSLASWFQQEQLVPASDPGLSMLIILPHPLARNYPIQNLLVPPPPPPPPPCHGYNCIKTAGHFIREDRVCVCVVCVLGGEVGCCSKHCAYMSLHFVTDILKHDCKYTM